MQIYQRPLSDIKPYEKNPRQKYDIQKVAQSIKEFGFQQPIVVDRAGTIIVGHGRYQASKSLGLETVPVVIADLSPEKAKAYRIADNKTNEYSDWDIGLLQQEFTDLLDINYDLELTGFDADELEKLIVGEKDGLTDEDAVPETPEEPKAQLGDIYKLGEHRLMCGDSTMIDQVDKLLDGTRPDMVFTDPPYGMDLDTNYKDIYKNAKSKTANQKKIIGDDKQFDPTFLLNISENVFIWGADYFCQMLTNNGSWFVWNKKIGKGKIGNEFELCWSKQKHKKEILEIEWAGFRGMEKDDGKRIHPTQKPIKLCSHFLNKFSKKENIIIDLFLGSGSTLIACEKTKRICYGMELDPKYIDVIIKRWEQYTGQKAQKIN